MSHSLIEEQVATLLERLGGELRWCAREHKGVNDDAFVCYDSMADGLKEVSDLLRDGMTLADLLKLERFQKDWATVPNSKSPPFI